MRQYGNLEGTVRVEVGGSLDSEDCSKWIRTAYYLPKTGKRT